MHWRRAASKRCAVFWWVGRLLVGGMNVACFQLKERTVGAYANKGYRQLFIKNYTVIYRIEEVEKRVIVVTVVYSRRNV
jgi:hypothetical protein